MFAVLQQLLAIAVLRAGPQDLPVDPRLPIWLAGAYALLGGVVLSPQLSFAEGVAQAGLDAVLLAAFAWGVLRFRGFRERFIQTYAALLGVSLVLTLLSWPLLAMAPLDPEAANWGAAQVGLLLALLWSLIAQGQILRSALEVGAGLGLLLAFAYFIVASLIIAAMFPAGSPT